MNDSKPENVSIALTTVLGWIGVTVVAVAAGTFAFTRLMYSERITHLESQLSVSRSDTAVSPSPSVLPKVLPEATIKAAGSDKETAKLVQRIHDLETEKSTLVSELVAKSEKALSPDSELSNLIAQLSSTKDEERRQAVRGLFYLRDPKSLPSLVSFFHERPEEATRDKSVMDWIDFIWALDRPTAISFMVQLLQSSNNHFSEWAYNLMSVHIDEQPEIGLVKQPLEALALRSEVPLVRTRAKILLQKFEGRAHEKAAKQKDNRSMGMVVDDIEKDVKELIKMHKSGKNK